MTVKSKGIDKIKLLQAVTTIVTGIIMLNAVLKKNTKQNMNLKVKDEREVFSPENRVGTVQY